MTLTVSDIGMFLTGGGPYHYAPFGTFNGTSDFVSVAHSSAFNVTNFSLAAWYRTSKDYTIAVEDGMIVNKGGTGFDPPNSTFNIRVFKETNMIRAGFEASDGTDHEPSSDPITVNDGQWHFCVVTNDGTVVRLYLDGVQVKQHTYNPPDAHVPELNSEPLVIGRNSNDSSRFFQGDIDEVRLWNTVLTPTEILALYSSGTVPQSGNIKYENTFGGSGSGSSNTDPNASLGGNTSATEVVSDRLNNLFRRITESEASSGITLYRCVTIKNKSITDEMRNAVFYMVSDTTSNDSLSLYSFAQAGKNEVETPIVNEFTAPTGVNINFIAALSRSTGIKLGDLTAGQFRNLWLRYTVNPGALPFPNDSFKVRVEVDGSGSSDPPAPPPDTDTGVNFSMAVLGDCSCGSSFNSNLNKIKARNPGMTVFNGDLAYSSGSQCFVDATSSIRSKSWITFGNHDVDESESQPSTKNALLNAWSLPHTYYSKTYNNVGMIFMESGENQSVSDSVGSAQYNFVKAALEGFKSNSAIEWIMVFNHYPLYGPSSNHSNNSGGRDRYDPLFDTNGVDAVFTSHNHNLWHTKLLKYNSGSPSSPTTAGTDPNYSYSKASSNHGKLYIGSGSGGKSHYSISSVPSYVTYDNDSDYGYVYMDFTNSGKKITFKIYSSSDSLKNTFTITHT